MNLYYCLQIFSDLSLILYIGIVWSRRLCFGGAPHIFQIEYSTNMSGTVELLDIWEMTTTLLMWPWPVRMISRWKLTRWSWLGRSALLNYLTVNITSTTLTTALSMSSRQEAAAVGEAMLSCRISPTQVRVFEWTFPGITATWLCWTLNLDKINISFKSRAVWSTLPSACAGLTVVCNGRFFIWHIPSQNRALMPRW